MNNYPIQLASAATFLQSWSDLHIRSAEFPITVEDAQNHAKAFRSAAAKEGISQAQIEEAIRGEDLRDVMFSKMRESVERRSLFS